MPKSFSFYPVTTDAWSLITPTGELAQKPWNSIVGAFGLLKPGITRAAAESELTAIQSQILVFSNDSVTDIPQVNGSCLKTSTAQEHELTNAFEAANRQSQRWEQRFTIPQGYRLMSRSQAAETQACLDTHGKDAARCDA
jgi:uncharacterized protein YbdZ (MbtH family)